MKRVKLLVLSLVLAAANILAVAQPTQALTCKVVDPYYVSQVQSALTKKGYKPGPVDGLMGTKTCSAIVSFQKAKKLTADGVVGANTGKALGLSSTISCGSGVSTCFLAVERTGYQGSVYVIRSNKVVKKLAATFGAKHSDGGGRTPTGKFTITRSIKGEHTSSIYPSESPNMNNPLYFNGAVAIHGSKLVGGASGSHGCVRIGWNESKDTYNYYKTYGVKTVIVRR